MAQNEDFVIGRHPALAALKSKQAVNKVFIQSGLKADALKEISALAKKKDVIVNQVPKAKLDLLADGQNHQGVVLAVAAYEYASLDQLFEQAEKKGEDPFFIILDGIEDPHNLGSCLLHILQIRTMTNGNTLIGITCQYQAEETNNT